MALMFTRLAHNFIKNGYFPTDDKTLEGVIAALEPSDGQVRLLDPCCGEGSALADLAHGLKLKAQAEGLESELETYGVEFDKERAWHAKSILQRVIHSDIHDVVIKPRSVNLLYLNPPYGFGLKDEGGGPVEDRKAERLERTFLKKTVPFLSIGGVLIYVVPYYALDDEIRSYLARHFTQVQFFMAPEQQFKQCVIFGVKTKAGHPRKEVLDLLAKGQAGELQHQVLSSQTWHAEPYVVPSAPEGQEFGFHAVRIDGEQLSDELTKWSSSTLWPGFQTYFKQTTGERRRPLRDMTRWHLALALAAGQVTGRIESKDGRIFLIKGDTFKKKERIVNFETHENGDLSETIIMMDKFVPLINAIEFTPDHRLGQIVKIS